MVSAVDEDERDNIVQLAKLRDEKPRVMFGRKYGECCQRPPSEYTVRVPRNISGSALNKTRIPEQWR